MCWSSVFFVLPFGIVSDGVAVGTQTTEGTKSSSFAFDTDNNNTVVGLSAALKLTLHF